jgi:hypothetical protein
MHNTQATLVAGPVRRSAPRRLTSSPLYTKYSAQFSMLAKTSAAPKVVFAPSSLISWPKTSPTPA